MPVASLFTALVAPGTFSGLNWGSPGRHSRSVVLSCYEGSNFEGKPSTKKQKPLSGFDDKGSSASGSSTKVYFPAAQSRGEMFLEKVLKEQKEKVLKEKKEKEKEQKRLELQRKKVEDSPIKKKEKKVKMPKDRQPYCYGCGALIQCSTEGIPGYIDAEMYAVKERHHQLKEVLCQRCRSLCHGKLVPAVRGYGNHEPEKAYVAAEELRQRLLGIHDERVIVLKLVDIVDISGCFMNRFRSLVGKNPIVLVVTKVDLLPKGTDLQVLGDWIIEYTQRRKLNVISVHLTSAKASLGISSVSRQIHHQREGRSVYILGAANVGKSAFISALLREMATRNIAAAAAKRFSPVQSAMPGTTIGPIAIKVFSGGGCIYDTPGVHLYHRMESFICPESLPLLFPTKRLEGYAFSAIPQRQSDTDLKTLAGISIFWGGLVRMDIIKAPRNTRFKFYASSRIPLREVFTSIADSFYADELGKTLVPPKKENISSWPGLERQKEICFDYDDQNGPVGDVAISGLGWIAIDFMQSSTEEIETKDCLRLAFHVPRGIEVYKRPWMPVGTSGKKWYKFRELPEDEKLKRPKLYFEYRTENAASKPEMVLGS